MAEDRIPHLLVIGGGFAGLTAVRRLKRAALRITLIDRCNHHLFQPLLYQVATAGLSAPAIAAPLRQILRRQENVTVLLGEVSSIDPAARLVTLGDGATFAFDFLLVATGARHSYFGHDDWARFAPGLKTLGDAWAIRRRILLAFEAAERETDRKRQTDWLSFAVVGGGPTGVELAGTLAEIARHTLKREFRHIDPTKASVRLIEAGPRILPTFDARLSENARRKLVKLGVEVHVGVPVTNIDGEGFRFGDRTVAARTVLWAAGVAASPLGRMLGTEVDRSGRVSVAPDLSVPGHPDIYVAGDLAVVRQDGAPVPGVASAAKQMGKHVAKAIQHRLRGETPPVFRHVDQGLLATIGRLAAVAQFGRIRLSGVVAWLVWLVAHIYFLIGFRNRLVVMIDWAWAYATYQRYARVIVEESEESKTGAEDPLRIR